MSDRDEIMRALAAIAENVERAMGDIVGVEMAVAVLFVDAALRGTEAPGMAIERLLAFLEGAMAKQSADPTAPVSTAQRAFMDRFRSACEAALRAAEPPP